MSFRSLWLFQQLTLADIVLCTFHQPWKAIIDLLHRTVHAPSMSTQCRVDGDQWLVCSSRYVSEMSLYVKKDFHAFLLKFFLNFLCYKPHGAGDLSQNLRDLSQNIIIENARLRKPVSTRWSLASYSYQRLWPIFRLSISSYWICFPKH